MSSFCIAGTRSPIQWQSTRVPPNDIELQVPAGYSMVL